MRNDASSSDVVLRLLAPAKINLHLRIGPKRDDGFHPLLTWMVNVGLFDSLSLSTGEGVSFSCDDSTLPADGRNLVVRAAETFRSSLMAHQPDASSKFGVSINLEKRIPAGGGLGGGSSDAARTLLGLNRLWAQEPAKLARDSRCLSDMGLSLGSDVPFFLFGPSSICRGRGEEVRPIGSPTNAPWVTLVLPPIGMPTAEVYRRFDEMGLGRVSDVEQEPVWEQWVSLNARDLLHQLVNDLEPPAFSLRPELGLLRDRLEKTLGQPVRMSGSGSSLFTLFDQREQAIEAAQRITSREKMRAVAVELAPMVQDDLSDA